MLRKKLLILLLFSLIVPHFVVAQRNEPTNSGRLENPLTLEQNRIPITDETSENIELLAVWGLGQLNNVTWLDDTNIAVGTSGGTWLYDINEPDTPNAVLPSLDPAGRDAAQSYLSPDGQWLAVTGNFESVHHRDTSLGIWHIATGNQHSLIPIYRQYGSNQPGVFFVGWIADNRYAVAERNIITVIELSSNGSELVATFTHEASERTSYTIENVALSEDKQWIASVTRSDISEQVVVQAWNVVTGEQHILYEDDILPQMPLWVDDLQFNVDGSELAMLVRVRASSDSYDTTTEVRRWTVESGDSLPAYEIDCSTFALAFQYNAVFCQTRHYQLNGYEIEFRDLDSGESLFESVFLERFVPVNLRQIFKEYGNFLVTFHEPDEDSDAQIYPQNVVLWNMLDSELIGVNTQVEGIKGSLGSRVVILKICDSDVKKHKKGRNIAQIRRFHHRIYVHHAKS